MIATKSPILDEFGHPHERVAPKVFLRAKHDAIRDDDPDTRNQWARADALGPNASATHAIREKYRNRARYEAANNTYVRGMVSTLANDTVGKCPRLQMETKSRKRNRATEKAWKEWVRETGFARKLRLMRQAKAVDGAVLGLFVTNPLLSSVQLDVRLLEIDYLQSPFGTNETEDSLAGIRFLAPGIPINYWLLDEHPGGLSARGDAKGKWYPRSRVVHYFHSTRAGQEHGLPEIGPALPLFTILRRYTLAVLGSAESAADVGLAMQTTGTAEVIPDDVEPFLEYEMQQRTMMFMPRGWAPMQVKAEQPTTTYPEFKHEILNEASRILNMPYNVAAGNSSGYNYSSGQMDHKVYFRAIEIERELMEIEIIDRVFDLWYREYILLTEGRVNKKAPPHRWAWDPFQSANPLDETRSLLEKWDRGLLSDDDFLLQIGVDPEDHFARLELQYERRRVNNMPLPGVAMQSIDVLDKDNKKTSSQGSELQTAS